MSDNIRVDRIVHDPPDPRPGQIVRLVMTSGPFKFHANYTAGTPGEVAQHKAISEGLKWLADKQRVRTPEQRGHLVKEVP